MNHLLTSPIGIDVAIQAIQEYLYDEIVQIWTGTINGYGRIQKYQSNAGMVPQYYKGDNEHSSVLFDDNVSGHFFFVDSDRHSTSDGYCYEAEVKCAFMVELPKIISGNEARKDAKAHQDAINTLRKLGEGMYEITGLETGINRVLQGFSLSDSMFDNNHPKHVFAVTMRLTYYVEC